MNLIEFIGFLISLLAVIVLMTKRRQIERYKKEHPEEFEKEELQKEEALKAFLKTLNIEMEEEKKATPAPPAVNHPKRTEKPKKTKSQPTPAMQLPLQKGSWKNNLKPQTIEYQVIKLGRNPRVRNILKNAPSLKEMVLYREILGPPKSFQ